MHFLQKIVAALCTLVLSFVTVSCNNVPELKSETYYDMFDTFVTVMAYGEDDESFEENCKKAKEALYECSVLFDIYREYDGKNNLATVNKNAGIKAVEVDENIIDLLEFSIEMHEKTQGRLNVAMGSVISLWHDCREKNAKEPGSAPLPSMTELEAAAEHTDISCVKIDKEKSTVYLEDGEMSLDAGAVAKGFAADIAVRILRESGITDGYAVNIGGNVVTVGEKYKDTAWRISVQSPYSEYNTNIASVEVRDLSLVSSGTYERNFELDGKRYHHIIDKDTLMPSEYFDGVSVLGGSSAMCDALSTALFCMPQEEGMALIESMDGVEALWVKDGKITRSPGFPEDKQS